MAAFWRVVTIAMLGVVPALGGCAISGLGAIGPVASAPPPVPAAPPPVVYGSFLEGPVGQKLSRSDRDKALAAEQDALAAGQRKAWRGDTGVYGYVEPAAAPAGASPSPVVVSDGIAATPPVTGAGDGCRSFTSTVYIAGRPQVGHGRGCPNPDGSYRVVG